MASVIYYKLKNAIQQQQVSFEGSVIQIGDVKRLVAEKQGLGSEGAHELNLYDPNTGEEYADDGKVVPRNTLVEVKRRPAAVFAPLFAGSNETKQGNGVDGTPDGPKFADAGAHAGDLGASVQQETHNGDGGVGEEESIALQNLLQGTASSWQREVRQGAMRGRGRGRGRGTVPQEYKCPRCEAYGAHWLQDCPTQGDPAYDKKRVRPPVGIPMTRLARSSEGGLVLPDGNTGTLVANEDAFAREILGLGALQTADQQTQPASPGTLAIEGPADDKGTPVPKEPAQGAPASTGMMPLSISSMGLGSQFAAPKLAGMNIDLTLKPKESQKRKEDEDFFENILKSVLLPRGPRAFLEKAYQRKEPLSKKEFEEEQRYYIKKYRGETRRSRSPGYRTRRDSKPRSRSRPRSRGRERYERDRSRDRENYERDRDRRDDHYRKRTRSRSRSRHRHARDRDQKPVVQRSRELKKDDKPPSRVVPKKSPSRLSQEDDSSLRMTHQGAEPEIDYGMSDSEADKTEEPKVISRAEQKPRGRPKPTKKIIEDNKSNISHSRGKRTPQSSGKKAKPRRSDDDLRNSRQSNRNARGNRSRRA